MTYENKAVDVLYMLGIIEELRNLNLTCAKHYITLPPAFFELTSVI
jgi:hypothetical protein